MTVSKQSALAHRSELCRILANFLLTVTEDDNGFMYADLCTFRNLKDFRPLLEGGFKNYTFRSPAVRMLALAYRAKYLITEELYKEVRRSKIHVKVANCGSCGEKDHRDIPYTVKFDALRDPYVICGITHKKIPRQELDREGVYSTCREDPVGVENYARILAVRSWDITKLL